MVNKQKELMRLLAVASALCVGITTGVAALATTPLRAPMLTAQRPNERIAVLQCGGYTITIRYVGLPGSERFSYQTQGLFLQNGVMEDSDYIFYNNDYEYRVTINAGSNQASGSDARLQVSHYGETILTKQCTWSN